VPEYCIIVRCNSYISYILYDLFYYHTAFLHYRATSECALFTAIIALHSLSYAISYRAILSPSLLLYLYALLLPVDLSPLAAANAVVCHELCGGVADDTHK